MNNNRLYGYVRVSTDYQNEERQLQLMKKHNIRLHDTFVDKASGKNFDRPQYQKLKTILQKGDSILISSMDRLGRNKQKCLEELSELQQKGVRIMIEDIPTSMISRDQNNSLILDMISNILIEVYTTMAEEELNRIKRRQREGIEAMPIINGKRVSKKTNRGIGRPNKQENLTSVQKVLIKSWMDGELQLSECLKETKLSESTLRRIKKNNF